jgi:hypothetical protein
MQILISIGALVIVLSILLHRIPLSFASPVYVLIGTYLVVLVGGTFLYNPAYGGASVSLFISEGESYAMIIQVLWLICGFGIGAILLTPARQKREGAGIQKRLTNDRTIFRLSTYRAVAAVLLASCALVLVVAGNGWDNIYSRVGYMAETNHLAKVIGYALLPVAVIALGAASTTRNGILSCAAIASTLGFVALTLALNTRMFCLIPALFFGGALMIQQNRKSLKVALAACLVTAPFMITIPLTGRRMAAQGLHAFPELIYEVSQTDPETSMHEILNNLFVSAPITTRSMRAKVNDTIEYILVGINPLPGFMTEWKTFQRRISRSTPFNAVGDLLRGSLSIGMCYFGILGAYLAHIDQNIRNTSRPPLSLFALMALSYMFTFMTLQYPLRSCTRLIYYMVCIETIVWLSAHRLRTRHGMSVHHQTPASAESHQCSTFAMTMHS